MGSRISFVNCVLCRSERNMWSFADLLKNFFTHKDFLPEASKIPGTMFTGLHFVFALSCLILVVWCAVRCSKMGEKGMRCAFFVLWVLLAVLEPSKIIWESVSGKTVSVELTGILPLYPCSIFLYAMPLVIWGRGAVRHMGCGYVCTLGLLGGSINFIYPANILSNYSCISFAGFHTFFYHGAIVFCALTVLLSGYHSYKGITKWQQLVWPAVPFLVVSLIANCVNFSPIDSDYMFFKLESFIFAPVGAALPDGVTVLIVYAAYLLIHAAPYLPSFVANGKRKGNL